eukprot:4799468-Alexandrium_andersonii.AAC.1
MGAHRSGGPGYVRCHGRWQSCHGPCLPVPHRAWPSARCAVASGPAEGHPARCARPGPRGHPAP